MNQLPNERIRELIKQSFKFQFRRDAEEGEAFPEYLVTNALINYLDEVLPPLLASKEPKGEISYDSNRVTCTCNRSAQICTLHGTTNF